MLAVDTYSGVNGEMIVDAHHHIWRQADLKWLQGPQQPRIFGEYGALQRDYPIEEFLLDVKASNVVKSVYVQANWPVDRSVDEVAWVQSVADRHGFPHGIVGYADLAASDVAETLDRMLAYKNLRGIRQQIHWHEKTLYRFAARTDLMNDPAWRRGLKEIEKRGLLFELQVFASQMADSVHLARDFPGLTFVLLHAGMFEDRSADGIAAWRKGMRSLSECPNVVTKFSGLGTFVRQCSVELWRQPVEETLALFGPARCMFGSNFPIEKLWTPYGAILSTMQALLAGASARDRQMIFHDTAARVYRLE
ncbi:MAG: amidohydrolase family protein [Burkholderiales bacterium]